MKVGIFLYKIDPSYKGGVASYVNGLLGGFLQLNNRVEYKLFCSSENYHLFNNKFDKQNVEVINLDVKIYGDNRFIKYRKKVIHLFVDYFAVLPIINLTFARFFCFFYKALLEYLRKSDCDIMYVPNTFPLYLSIPIVASIHDIQHVHYPQFFSWGQRVHRKVYFHEAVKNSSVVQASSEYMAKDFRDFFKLEKDKVVVVKDGIDNIFRSPIADSKIVETKNKFKITDHFIFYPAQHWQHKNHITLIKAISILKDNFNINIDLILTGEINKKYDYLYSFIADSSVRQQIKLLGNVSREELICLYKLCDVVAMTSLHESNSLVVLEALAAGALVVASDIEPNVELNDGSFAIFKQLDASDLAQKIFELLSSIRKNILIENGKKLSSNFTWEKAAGNYLNIFNSLINK